jgi:hypothetical protein
MGFFDMVGKAINGYKDGINKEKERMLRWTDARLAREAQTKSVLPSGMAAMQILKERGYSGSDIARM